MTANSIADVLHGAKISYGGRKDGYIFIDANAAHAIDAVLSAAGFGLVADAKAEALREAAEALEMQAPKLRAQYVETLRLYASEPWRLTTCPSECAASHPGREHEATP